MSWNLITLDNYSRGIDDLYHTNSVVLPPRILEENSTCLDLFVFKIIAANGLSTYVGVREFSAPDDHLIVPWWILDYLGIGANQVITLEKAEGILPGKKVVFEPKEQEFFDIPECEGCLEQKLSNFTVLHQGETICLNILEKNYHILVKEVEPDWSKMELGESKDDELNKPKKKKRGRKTKNSKKAGLYVETDLDDIKENKVINANVINIKNIDLTVEINNPFLKSNITDNGNSTGLIAKPNISKNTLPPDDESKKILFNNKGNKLGGTIYNSKEEMIEARLKKLGRMIPIKNRNIDI